MEKKHTHFIVLIFIMLFPSPAFSGLKHVQVEGDSEFFYGGTLGESNALYDALSKLRKSCENKGMTLYEGRRLKHTTGQRFSLIQYDHLKCTEKDGGKRCTIKAEGICMAKDSYEFNIKCGPEKRVYARQEALPGGGVRIVTQNYTVLNLNASTVKLITETATIPGTLEPVPVSEEQARAQQRFIDSICREPTDPTLIQRLKSVLKKMARKSKEKLAKCKELRKANKDLPPECLKNRENHLDAIGTRG